MPLFKGAVTKAIWWPPVPPPPKKKHPVKVSTPARIVTTTVTRITTVWAPLRHTIASANMPHDHIREKDGRKSFGIVEKWIETFYSIRPRRGSIRRLREVFDSVNRLSL